MKGRTLGRRGIGLAWILVALGVAATLMGTLWSEARSMAARGRRLLRGEQARLLTRGAMSHGLHKVERTASYFEARLGRGPGASIDLGAEDPAYLEDLSGSFDLEGGGRASWRVVAMQVTRNLSARGEPVYQVRMQVESAVAAGEDRWRESLEGDVRLFPRGPGGSRGG